MIAILKERKTMLENPYLDMAYDIDNDEFITLGMSLPNVAYHIQEKLDIDNIGSNNYFDSGDFFEDHNCFDEYYGESI